MTRTSLFALIFTITVCLATQLLPVFPFGGPPPSGGKLNFYGWPCLSVTTIANADAAGRVYEQYRLYRPFGMSVNAVVILLSGSLMFAGVAWSLVSRFPRVSLLDLFAFTTSVAVVLGYFLLIPNYGLPLATLADSTATKVYFTTDRTIASNILCAILIALSVFGAISLAAIQRVNKVPTHG